MILLVNERATERVTHYPLSTVLLFICFVVYILTLSKRQLVLLVKGRAPEMYQ